MSRPPSLDARYRLCYLVKENTGEYGARHFLEEENTREYGARHFLEEQK